ncbi:MAG TPA: YceI family protein [Puia sp.]|nr:YceI family protein [Puia sp.]
MKITAIIFGLLLATNWTVDTANARVGFSVHGPFGTVNGTFSGLAATIHFDPNDLPGSSIQASIDASTVNSGIGLRNHHLKSEEQYLNTDKYPRISYTASRIERTGSGFRALGNLTIKDVTRPVAIPFSFTPNGNNRMFKGAFSFRREDFHVGKEGGSIGDTITIHLEVPVKK